MKPSVTQCRTVLITGASTGFGRDTAETLAKAGHKVFASFRDIDGYNKPHADALRQQLIEVVELDVGDDASVDRAVAAVLARIGKLDVLINNAGISAAGVTEGFTSAQAEEIFNINALGVLRTTRSVLPAMRACKDGLIINIGSILGRVTFPFFGIYGASKFAVEALTDSYRYELSQLGIEVVLVQPSAYPTAMLTNARSPADTARGDAYGAIGKIPDQMLETFIARFKAADAPNPHDVGQAIAELIARSKGERPARTVVGAPFGADAVNAHTAPIQERVVAELGLGGLATFPKPIEVVG